MCFCKYEISSFTAVNILQIYITILIWFIPVCYSKYRDNKHRHTTVYIYFAHYVIYFTFVPVYYMFRLGRAIVSYMYKC
jgi:hypothetical protein